MKTTILTILASTAIVFGANASAGSDIPNADRCPSVEEVATAQRDHPEDPMFMWNGWEVKNYNPAHALSDVQIMKGKLSTNWHDIPVGTMVEMVYCTYTHTARRTGAGADLSKPFPVK